MSGNWGAGAQKPEYSPYRVGCPGCAPTGIEPAGGVCRLCGGHGSIDVRRGEHLPTALRITLVVIVVLRQLCGCVLALAGALCLGPIAFCYVGKQRLAAVAIALVAIPAFWAGCHLAGRLALALTGALTLLAGGSLYLLGMFSNDPQFVFFPLLGVSVAVGGGALLVAAFRPNRQAKGWQAPAQKR